MDTQKQQIVDRLKQANNILLTVSNNPSVDQLASCIAFTLALNKLGKHATAVFSGAVPSTIEFLQPEKTLEKNTDSLRDFIIALDKAKADKLRYKVEDKVVKIFITPYRTSISDKDLIFSQGDFNVDVVIALGVHSQIELDQAITSHGRILHDAAVVAVNTKPGGELGSINWVDPAASSLSELVFQLVDLVDKTLMDSQMATALLTGIVAETDRFSNAKTSPSTMSISAALMAAGANQQLVATKLEVPPPPPKVVAPPIAAPAPPAPMPQAQFSATPPEPPKPDDGTLEINHGDSRADAASLRDDQPPAEPSMPQIDIDEHGSLSRLDQQKASDGSIDPAAHMESQHMILQPPSMGGQLTANSTPEQEEDESSGDPLSTPQPGAPQTPLLSRESQSLAKPASSPSSFGASPSPVPPLMPSPQPLAPASSPITPPQTFMPSATPQTFQPSQPPPALSFTPPSNETLSAIERDVNSPHLAQVASMSPPAPTPSPATSPVTATPSAGLDDARNAVLQAIAAQPQTQPEPISALNAQPLGDPLHDQTMVVTPPPPMPVDPAAAPPSNGMTPPPVPPPMMPV